MRYVRLGQTDLEVSAISLGTWAFGGDWGPVDPHQAKATIHRARDLGVTLFDTAQAYGFGAAERLLGDALRDTRHHGDVIIATKGGLRQQGNRLVRDASPGWLRHGVEQSLRNLGVDRIDLYQVHWPDPATPAEETAGALEALVAEGKIGHAGVSNYDLKQIDQLARHGRLETLQPPYHMFRRGIEGETLPYTIDHDIGVLVYGPLAHGLLSGRITYWTRFSTDDWRSHSPDFTGKPFRHNLDIVAQLKEFAHQHALTLPQLGVAWTLARPGVDVAIVGARRPAHVAATVAAADLALSRRDLDDIDRILADAVPLEGPHPEAMP